MKRENIKIGRGRIGVGDACKLRKLLFSLFRPLINYPKPTQLWNIWLSKLSNQNHATSFVTKSVGVNAFSYFLFLLFCARKYILKFEDRRTLGKARRSRSKKKAIVTMFVKFARKI